MDTLSIEAASAIQQSKIANQISYAVAKKSMDSHKLQGQAAVALLQQVADVGRQLADGYIDVEL
jgi:hypothetical protein